MPTNGGWKDPERQIRDTLQQIADRRGLSSLTFNWERFYGETVLHEGSPKRRMTKRVGWWALAAGLMAVLLAAPMVWHQGPRVASSSPTSNLKKLVPSPSRFPHAIMLRGQRDGFRSRIVASLTENFPYPTFVSGYWILSYVGHRPPTIERPRLTGWEGPNGDVLLSAVPDDGARLRPKKVGPNQYVYSIVRWQRENLTGSDEAGTREAFMTSQVIVMLSSGKRISIPEQAPNAGPGVWNSRYWFQKPPTLLWGTIEETGPHQILFQKSGASKAVSILVTQKTRIWSHGRLVPYQPSMNQWGDSVAIRTRPASPGSSDRVAEVVYLDQRPSLTGIVTRVGRRAITIAVVKPDQNGKDRKTGQLLTLAYNHNTNFTGTSPADLHPGEGVSAMAIGSGKDPLLMTLSLFKRGAIKGLGYGWHQITP